MGMVDLGTPGSVMVVESSRPSISGRLTLA